MNPIDKNEKQLIAITGRLDLDWIYLKHSFFSARNTPTTIPIGSNIIPNIMGGGDVWTNKYMDAIG